MHSVTLAKKQWMQLRMQSAAGYMLFYRMISVDKPFY